MNVLVAVIACPRPLCSLEFEGNWLEPQDPEDEAPADCLQLCPGCGHAWTEPWPGFAFRTEAG